jgi:hypothetical protein
VPAAFHAAAGAAIERIEAGNRFRAIRARTPDRNHAIYRESGRVAGQGLDERFAHGGRIEGARAEYVPHADEFTRESGSRGAANASEPRACRASAREAVTPGSILRIIPLSLRID